MNKQRKSIIQIVLLLTITLLMLFSIENNNSLRDQFPVPSEEINVLKSNDADIILLADKISGG